jgi:hypothetical protein
MLLNNQKILNQSQVSGHLEIKTNQYQNVSFATNQDTQLSSAGQNTVVLDPIIENQPIIAKPVELTNPTTTSQRNDCCKNLDTTPVHNV